MIEVKHLGKKYENATPLKDINFVINPGDVISIIGPSGTGKSTLLRMINALEIPTSGEVIYEGRNIYGLGVNLPDIRKHIGMVFQSFNLNPRLTIIENIMKPQVDILKRTKQEAYDKAVELLKVVGLLTKRYNMPSELSGGQKQRVAIARTLSLDPEIILFDEPTSALDPATVGEVENIITKLANKGHTMMIVTHDMSFAKSIATRVFYIDEGIIYEEGSSSDIFDHPKKEKTQKFVFSINNKEINIDSKFFDYASCYSEIGRYASKNTIDYRKHYKLQLLFEETVVNSIVNHIEGDLKIKVLIKYNKNDKLEIGKKWILVFFNYIILFYIYLVVYLIEIKNYCYI